METFFEAGMETGECPIWDARIQTLYCVDSTNPALWIFSSASGSVERRALPLQIGFVALTQDVSKVVLGLEDGLYTYDLQSRKMQLIIDPEPGNNTNRINDGAADLDGGILFGTLDMGLTEPTGAAYKLFPDGRLVKFDQGYIVFNGPFADPSGKRIFTVNSEIREVYVFDRMLDGSFANRRLFTHWPEEWGIPDGLVMDEEGGVWIGHWGGKRATRFSPDGEYLEHLDFPVSRVTKIAFGGPDRKTIYATTANRGIDYRSEPLAGSVFRHVHAVGGVRQQEVAASIVAASGRGLKR